MPNRLVLTGIHGLFKDKKYYIEEGQSVVIGRSHSCDFILDPGPLSDMLHDFDEIEQINRHLQTISRKHLRITFHNEVKVELEDLSANGTRLDEERIARVFLADITTENHIIQLGSREKFLLELESIG